MMGIKNIGNSINSNKEQLKNHIAGDDCGNVKLIKYKNTEKQARFFLKQSGTVKVVIDPKYANRKNTRGADV